MRLTRLLAVIAVAASLGGLPAQAGAGIVASADSTATRIADGYLVAAVCDASVTMSAADEIVVTTTVHCSINGVDSPTVTMPGAGATTAVATVTSAPITVCVDASAVVMPLRGTSYPITTGPSCFTRSG